MHRKDCALGLGCAILLLLAIAVVVFIPPTALMHQPPNGSAWLEGSALAGEQNRGLYAMELLIRAPAGANKDVPLPFGSEVVFSVLEKDHTLLIGDTKWLVLESHSYGESGADIENLGVEFILGRFRVQQLSDDALKHGQAGELFVLTHSGRSQNVRTKGLLIRVNPEMRIYDLR